MDRLHDDAVRALTDWSAPDPEQDRLRTSFLAHLRRHPDGLTRGCVPAHLTASAFVVDATGKQLLLTLHGKGGFWAQLGGHCEPADLTLAGAALREATEESGIDGLRVVGGGPIDLDRHRLSDAFGSCGEHLDVRYLVVAPAGAQPVVSEESDDVRWFSWDALPRDAVGDLARIAGRARTLVGSGAGQSSAGSTSSGSIASPDAAATPSR